MGFGISVDADLSCDPFLAPVGFHMKASDLSHGNCESTAMIAFWLAGPFVLLCLGVTPVKAADQKGQRYVAPADALFKIGKFAEAEKVYAQVLTQEPKNYRATGRLGYISLLSNRLDEAQKWLEKAVEIKPDEVPAKALLADVFYRRDDFQKA